MGELTLRGILKSKSGNEITPTIFPTLRTTTVASICRVTEEEHSVCTEYGVVMADGNTWS